MPPERQRLEAIVHPLVRVATDAEMHSRSGAAPYVVHMVPCCSESKDFASASIARRLVDADEDTQIRRVSTT